MARTFGEFFNSALECKTEEEAGAWMEAEIVHNMSKEGGTHEEAVSKIRHNLGYMAGYYDRETAEKVLRLFGAGHPVFGVDYHPS